MLSLLDATISTSFEEGSEEAKPLRCIRVSFTRAPVELVAITFENYYVAALSISHTHARSIEAPVRGTHTSGRDPTWTTVLPEIPLMADSNREDDAQAHHEILGSQLSEAFDRRRVSTLRLECRQPSTSFRDFELRKLRFYTLSEVECAPAPARPPALDAEEQALAASLVTQLRGLGTVARRIRSTLASALAEPEAAPREPRRAHASAPSATAAAPTYAPASAPASAHTAAPAYAPAYAPAAAPAAAAPRIAPQYRLGEWADEWRLPFAPPRCTSATGSAPSTPSTPRVAAPPAPTRTSFAARLEAELESAAARRRESAASSASSDDLS